jgi:ribosome maturation factor RimP
MTHPLIPKILELAAPVAESLELEVVGAVFQTNQFPPVLRVDIRNPCRDTGLEDCEQMSMALEAALDQVDLIPDAYVLEVSSPGVSQSLSADRDFVSFKGFPVTVTTSEPYKGHTTWAGQLLRRDEQAVHISQKGRAIAIPRHLVVAVELADA